MCSQTCQTSKEEGIVTIFTKSSNSDILQGSEYAFDAYQREGNIGTQPAFVCSKSTLETLEQSVKYVQS